MDHLCYCHAFASVRFCLVVTQRERADLLALVCDVYCDFVTFLVGILEQVWYMIVSIPDPCCLSYFENLSKFFRRFYNFYFWQLLLNRAIYAILLAGIIENRYLFIFEMAFKDVSIFNSTSSGGSV